MLNCDRVVRDSLRVVQKKRHRVVVIPSLRYKMIYALYHTPVISQIASAIIVALFKR
ncbi:MAG: hypothetical protein FWH27_01825 [Planctomycetaceae bacterium]|nr:hypothetical protein [Planctomycetaceae bacterium]